MARVEVIKCDICGAIKGEANKWLKAIVTANPPRMILAPCFVVRDEPLDLCSDTCLQKKLAEVLTQIRDYELHASVKKEEAQA